MATRFFPGTTAFKDDPTLKEKIKIEISYAFESIHPLIKDGPIKKLIRSFLNAGGDINESITKSKKSLVYLTIEYRRPKILSFLYGQLDEHNDVDLFLPDSDNKTPYNLAITAGIDQFLRTAILEKNPQMLIAFIKNPDGTFKALAELKLNPKKLEKLLRFAIFKDSFHCLNILLDFAKFNNCGKYPDLVLLAEYASKFSLCIYNYLEELAIEDAVLNRNKPLLDALIYGYVIPKPEEKEERSKLENLFKKLLETTEKDIVAESSKEHQDMDKIKLLNEIAFLLEAKCKEFTHFVPIECSCGL